MLLASRPGAVALDRRELELLVFGREHPRGAVGWVIGGTTAHRLIDHVDDIALFDKKLGPAFATVGCSHPVGRRLRRAVDQDERIRPSLYLRRQNFDEDLTLHNVLAGLANIMTPDVKKAATGDADWSTVGTGSFTSASAAGPTNAATITMLAVGANARRANLKPGMTSSHKFASRHKPYHSTCRLSRRHSE